MTRDLVSLFEVTERRFRRGADARHMPEAPIRPIIRHGYRESSEPRSVITVVPASAKALREDRAAALREARGINPMRSPQDRRHAEYVKDQAEMAMIVGNAEYDAAPGFIVPPRFRASADQAAAG